VPYVGLDDNFPHHPKVSGLTDKAFRLWVTTIAFCARNLTDGHVSHAEMRGLAAGLGCTKKQVVTLIEQDLLRTTPHGYELHDYLYWNPPRETVLRRREQAKNRQARKRHKDNVSRRDTTREFTGPLPCSSLEPLVVDQGTPHATPPTTAPAAPAEATTRGPTDTTDSLDKHPRAAPPPAFLELLNQPTRRSPERGTGTVGSTPYDETRDVESSSDPAESASGVGPLAGAVQELLAGLVDGEGA